MDQKEDLPATHRLQSRPNIVLGLNAQELMYAICLCTVFSGVFSAILGYVLSNLLLGAGSFLVTGFVSFVVAGRYMQRVKHGRPNGYYKQKVLIRLQRLGFGSVFIIDSGYKDLKG